MLKNIKSPKTIDKMNKMNKILQLDAPQKPVWRDVAMPDVANNEVLVQIEAVTTCPHWDLHIFYGEPMFAGHDLRYPYIPAQPGHEAVGRIEAIGSEVTAFREGQRVAFWRDRGSKIQGAYARFIAIEPEHLLAIPEHLPADKVASLELAMCVQGSFDQLIQRSDVRGKRLAISGLGAAGLVAVQLAKAHGAHEIIGLDVMPERCDLAMQLGATSTLNPMHDTLPANRNAADAFDAALDTTGLKVSIETLMQRTKRSVAIFGVLREEIAFTPHQWWGDFALLGYGTHQRSAAETALQCILDGTLDLSVLVSAKMGFDQYADAVQMLKDKQAIKVMFDPWMA